MRAPLSGKVENSGSTGIVSAAAVARNRRPARIACAALKNRVPGNGVSSPAAIAASTSVRDTPAAWASSAAVKTSATASDMGVFHPRQFPCLEGQSDLRLIGRRGCARCRGNGT
jgi:hypothetical protein